MEYRKKSEEKDNNILKDKLEIFIKGQRKI